MDNLTQMLKCLECPSTSHWLRYAAETALKRDPVDALNDIEFLRSMLRKKIEEAKTNHLKQPFDQILKNL